LLLAFVPALLAAQPDPAALAQRFRADLDAYDKLVDELDLHRLPGDLLNYPLVSENLQRLGNRLESLSRLALELDRTPNADWTRLAEALQLFENDLHQLRCQSLPLRVWGYVDGHGRKQPEWGLAVNRSAEPLPRAKGTFDGEATGTLELTLKPGASCAVQIIVVPLTKDLRRVRAEVGDLKGPGGKLRAAQMTLRAVDYEGQPHSDRPDVPQDLSQAFMLTIAAPGDLKAGEYRGTVRVTPEGMKGLGLELRVTVE
jgi:hypothetical protein